jgi:hypothetical protein
MVVRYDDYGNIYHEPPYTQAESDEMFRAMSGPIRAFSRPSPASADPVLPSSPSGPAPPLAPPAVSPYHRPKPSVGRLARRVRKSRGHSERQY